MEFLDLILDHWKLIAFLLGLTISSCVVIYITIKIVVPENSKKIRELQKKMELALTIDSFLDRCKASQTTCQAGIITTLNQVAKQLEEMDRERDQARKEFEIELRKISRFIGNVERYMEDHNGKTRIDRMAPKIE